MQGLSLAVPLDLPTPRWARALTRFFRWSRPPSTTTSRSSSRTLLRCARAGLTLSVSRL